MSESQFSLFWTLFVHVAIYLLVAGGNRWEFCKYHLFTLLKKNVEQNSSFIH